MNSIKVVEIECIKCGSIFFLEGGGCRCQY